MDKDTIEVKATDFNVLKKDELIELIMNKNRTIQTMEHEAKVKDETAGKLQEVIRQQNTEHEKFAENTVDAINIINKKHDRQLRGVANISFGLAELLGAPLDATDELRDIKKDKED